MTPLADSAIWEMAKRGEFPRRFLLTLRCTDTEAFIMVALAQAVHVKRRNVRPQSRGR